MYFLRMAFLISLMFFVSTTARAESYVINEAALFVDQASNSCSIIEAGYEDVFCETNEDGYVLTVNRGIENTAFADLELSRLKYEIRQLQINVMRSGQKFRIVDLTASPHRTVLYGFVQDKDNYGGRLRAEHSQPLESYCSDYKILPRFCKDIK